MGRSKLGSLMIRAFLRRGGIFAGPRHGALPQFVPRHRELACHALRRHGAGCNARSIGACRLDAYEEAGALGRRRPGAPRRWWPHREGWKHMGAVDLILCERACRVCHQTCCAKHEPRAAPAGDHRGITPFPPHWHRRGLGLRRAARPAANRRTTFGRSQPKRPRRARTDR